MSKILLLAFFSALLTGCGKGDLSSQPARLDQLLPGNFFAKPTGDCESGNLSFQTLIANGILQNTDLGERYYGQMELELTSAATYRLLFREYDLYHQVYHKIAAGIFSVNPFSHEILFPQLGVGKIGRYKQKPTLELSISGNFQASTLKGQIVTFFPRKVSETISETRAMYCERQGARQSILRL
jgi:hypothetical protein